MLTLQVGVDNLLGMTHRLELFSDHLRRLDPTSSSADALRAGWVLEPPGSIVEGLVRSLELKIPRRHVMFGGVGAGKTTELLRIQERLSTDPNHLVVYVDVSAHAELRSLKRGAVLAIAGIALIDHLKELGRDHPFSSADRAWLQKHTFGYEDWSGIYPDEGWQRAPEPEVVPGVAERAGSVKQYGEISDRMQQILDRYLQAAESIFFLIDGLDRIWDLEILDPLVRNDLQILHRLRKPAVSVLMVAPLSVYLGEHQTFLRGAFDRDYTLPYLDVRKDDVLRWFVRVLQKRDVSSLLSEEICAELARLSGGVLRDLFMLAQNAVEEAYVEGADQVETRHVMRVAMAQGRKLLIGAGKEQLAALQSLSQEGTFELVTDADLDLVLHRRALFYAEGSYAVHPTIVPLLPKVVPAVRAA